MRRISVPILVAFVAGIAVAVGGFVLFDGHAATTFGNGMMSGSSTSASTSGVSGPGMMGSSTGRSAGSGMMGNGAGMMGNGAGMMGGYASGSTQTSVTAAELAAVHDRVEKQLNTWGYKDFTVGEIMAFSNNDYVLVKDASGKPAFELLADPKGQWLRPEPGPNMMWNTSYGMMKGVAVPGCPAAAAATGAANGSPLSAAEARAKADAWLADHFPARVTADATTLPGYFTIDLTTGGKKVGMLSVNSTTGAVWNHTWHRSFLADQDF